MKYKGTVNSKMKNLGNQESL